MLKWIAQKFLGSEIDADLKGLQSLPSIARLKTTVEILERVDQGLTLVEQGTVLNAVQQIFRDTRRAAVVNATGYSDPKHLVGSVPEHFFVAMSPSYGESKRVADCRSIANALEMIVQKDGGQLLGKQEAREATVAVAATMRRLAAHKLL